jgi:hypothetical protein
VVQGAVGRRVCRSRDEANGIASIQELCSTVARLVQTSPIVETFDGHEPLQLQIAEIFRRSIGSVADSAKRGVRLNYFRSAGECPGSAGCDFGTGPEDGTAVSNDRRTGVGCLLSTASQRERNRPVFCLYRQRQLRHRASIGGSEVPAGVDHAEAARLALRNIQGNRNDIGVSSEINEPRLRSRPCANVFPEFSLPGCSPVT